MSLSASCTVWVVALALLVAPLRAYADKPALHWVRGSGAEACIDPRNLARLVEDITGPALVAAGQADISIEAQIEVSPPDAYTVRMRLISRSAASSGERVQRFQTDDCRSLDRSIALLIATAIDPTLGAEGVPKELNWVDEDSWSTADSLRRELVTQPSPARAPAPSRSVAPAQEKTEPAPAPETPRRWQLGLAAVGGSGVDKRVSAGLLLDLTLTLSPRVLLLAQLSGETPFGARELGNGRSVLAQRFALAVLACLQLPLSATFELRGCAGPELAGVLAHGDGFQMNRTALVGAGGALARLAVQREIGSAWKLSAGLLLHVELGRARTSYERAASSVEAFRVAPWQLQAALGVAYAF